METRLHSLYQLPSIRQTRQLLNTLKTGACYKPNSANNSDISIVIIFQFAIPTHQLTVSDDTRGCSKKSLQSRSDIVNKNIIRVFKIS